MPSPRRNRTNQGSLYCAQHSETVSFESQSFVDGNQPDKVSKALTLCVLVIYIHRLPSAR